jgi:hypothetical protein
MESKQEKPPLPDPFLVWYHVNRTDTFHLNTLSVKQQRQYLSDLLGLRQHYVDRNDLYNAERREVFLDMCTNLLNFCRKSKFSAERTSTLLSLIFVTHTHCCETPGSLVTVEEGYAFFEKHLLRHSVERPPFSIAVFSYHDLKKICDYVVNSYFRHLKLYQYVFGITKELQLEPVYSQAAQVDMDSFPMLDDAYDYKETESADPSEVLRLPHPMEEQLDEEEKEDISATQNMMMVDADEDEASAGDVALSKQERARFDSTLSGEMAKLRAEFAAKLQDQEASFVKRLAEQGKTKPQSKGKKQ